MKEMNIYEYKNQLFILSSVLQRNDKRLFNKNL